MNNSKDSLKQEPSGFSTWFSLGQDISGAEGELADPALGKDSRLSPGLDWTANTTCLFCNQKKNQRADHTQMKSCFRLDYEV